MTPSEKLEWLAKTVQTLNARVVLVEGTRDARALAALGVTAPVLCAAGQNVNRVANRASRLATGNGQAPSKLVAIVTDFDAEGRRLFADLATALEGANARVDRQSAARLRQSLGLTCVEDALPALERLRDQAGDP